MSKNENLRNAEGNGGIPLFIGNWPGHTKRHNQSGSDTWHSSRKMNWRDSSPMRMWHVASRRMGFLGTTPGCSSPQTTYMNEGVTDVQRKFAKSSPVHTRRPKDRHEVSLPTRPSVLKDRRAHYRPFVLEDRRAFYHSSVHKGRTSLLPSLRP